MRYLLAGDSTVAECEPNELAMSGWGASLPQYIGADDTVLNFAKGGATTKSFREEGHWQAVLDALQPGDTVIIQFGHNDQKHPELLAASGGYTNRLRDFVREARSAGARVVLCTSVERRLFEGGRIRWSHGAYPAAVRQLARGVDVPVIELTAFTTWLYEHLGEEKSAQLFTPSDNTHFHEKGADAIASYIAITLRGLEGRDDALASLGRPEIMP
ncbi:MAG TPA: rhamnogalacturonan acetylesterase [Glaciihabitans sp.]|jgi:lysophospholipase L1-like esterase|nr:rhamnogalacturonan acetylesterase [Glaciihabitans sp.]